MSVKFGISCGYVSEPALLNFNKLLPVRPVSKVTYHGATHRRLVTVLDNEQERVASSGRSAPKVRDKRNTGSRTNQGSTKVHPLNLRKRNLHTTVPAGKTDVVITQLETTPVD